MRVARLLTFAALESATFDLVKESGENAAVQSHDGQHEEVSAADYDPDEDRRRDDQRQLEHLGHVAEVGASGATAAAAIETNGQDSASEYEEIEVEEEDDLMDMFAESEPRKVIKRVKKAKASKGDGGQAKPYVPVVHRGGDAATTAGLLVDNFDDDEGYYRVILGELLDDGRYHVHANLGKGMFSNVVRAIDTTDSHEVAIKIVRSQETMCVEERVELTCAGTKLVRRKLASCADCKTPIGMTASTSSVSSALSSIAAISVWSSSRSG